MEYSSATKLFYVYDTVYSSLIDNLKTVCNNFELERFSWPSLKI